MVFSSALAVPLSDVSWGVISVFAEGEQQTASAMLESSINFYNNRVEYNNVSYPLTGVNNVNTLLSAGTPIAALHHILKTA